MHYLQRMHKGEKISENPISHEFKLTATGCSSMQSQASPSTVVSPDRRQIEITAQGSPASARNTVIGDSFCLYENRAGQSL